MPLSRGRETMRNGPPEQQRGFWPEAGSRYVDTAVARFHYLREGQGPTVVLLSPGAASTFAWGPELTALARTHTVCVAAAPEPGGGRRVALTGGVRVPGRAAIVPIGVRREAERALDRLALLAADRPDR